MWDVVLYINVRMNREIASIIEILDTRQCIKMYPLCNVPSFNITTFGVILQPSNFGFHGIRNLEDHHFTSSSTRHTMSTQMSSIFADLLTNNFPRSSQDTESDTDDLSTLPFPQPLSRNLFSSQDFHTESFLLTHSQFRTLDDLRSELRTWVDKLENEMETLIEE